MARMTRRSPPPGLTPAQLAKLPPWRRVACGLCGAKIGAACLNLNGALGGRVTAPTTAIFNLRQPHAVRVAAARSLAP
jgi:hypothetical protein